LTDVAVPAFIVHTPSVVLPCLGVEQRSRLSRKHPRNLLNELFAILASCFSGFVELLPTLGVNKDTFAIVESLTAKPPLLQNQLTTVFASLGMLEFVRVATLLMHFVAADLKHVS